MKNTNRRRFLASTMATIGLPALQAFAADEKPTTKPKTFVDLILTKTFRSK